LSSNFKREDTFEDEDFNDEGLESDETFPNDDLAESEVSLSESDESVSEKGGVTVTSSSFLRSFCVSFCKLIK
jgi:hypothetical protein